jgi:hypothetical protein
MLCHHSGEVKSLLEVGERAVLIGLGSFQDLL